MRVEAMRQIRHAQYSVARSSGQEVCAAAAGACQRRWDQPAQGPPRGRRGTLRQCGKKLERTPAIAQKGHRTGGAWSSFYARAWGKLGRKARYLCTAGGDKRAAAVEGTLHRGRERGKRGAKRGDAWSSSEPVEAVHGAGPKRGEHLQRKRMRDKAGRGKEGEGEGSLGSQPGGGRSGMPRFLTRPPPSRRKAIRAVLQC